MGWSKIQIEDDPFIGQSLVIGGEARKGGAWVARIVGLDARYTYARQFLGEKRYPRDARGCVEVIVPLTDLQEGDLLEILAGGSWKNEYRDFYVFENGDVKRISERELRERLAAKLKAEKD